MVLFCSTGFTEKVEINGTKLITNKSENIIVYMRKLNAYPDKRIVNQESENNRKHTSNTYEVTEDIIDDEAPIPYHLNQNVQQVLRKNTPNYSDYYLNSPKFLFNINRNPIVISANNKPNVKTRKPKIQSVSENYQIREDNFKTKRKLIQQRNVTEEEEDIFQTAESKYSQYNHNPGGRNSYEVTEEPEEIEESEDYEKNYRADENTYNIPNTNYFNPKNEKNYIKPQVVLIPRHHDLYAPLHEQKNNPVTLVLLKPVTIAKKFYKPVRLIKVLKPYYIPNDKETQKPILIKVLKPVENNEGKKYLIHSIQKPILVKVLKPVSDSEGNRFPYKNLLSSQIPDEQQNYYYREDVQLTGKPKSFQFYNLVNYGPKNEIKIQYSNDKEVHQNTKNNEEEKDDQYIYYYNQKPKPFINPDYNAKN